MEILLTIGILFMPMAIYMLARNEWVYRLRTRVLSEDMEAYCALPTYNQMLYKYWWVWRAKYFYSSNVEDSRTDGEASVLTTPTRIHQVWKEGK